MPDLTPQVEFFARTLQETVSESLPDELSFLRLYDQARSAVREVVDLPDRKLDLMMVSLVQNNGRLSKSKRKHFAELTDAEVSEIQKAFQVGFSDDDDEDETVAVL